MDTINMRISKEQKELIVKASEKRGISITQLMMDSLEFYLSFDPFFVSKIKGVSETIRIPEYLVIQNMIIKRIAKDAAKVEVYGSDPSLLPEFAFTDKGPVTGIPLFKMLKSMFKHQFEMEKKNKQALLDSHLPSSPPDVSENYTLIAKEQAFLKSISDKKGINLTEEEKAFLESWPKEEEPEKK